MSQTSEGLDEKAYENPLYKLGEYEGRLKGFKEGCNYGMKIMKEEYEKLQVKVKEI